MWAYRPVRIDEAAEACTAIRLSIVELCGTDHGGDPAILGPWLANKTPKQVEGWIRINPLGVLAAVGRDGIGGVGAVLSDGRIVLNYVAPWARFQGASKGLVGAMEQRAAELGNTGCTLTSTATARGFYRSLGYRDAGAPVASFGGKSAYPMRREFGPGAP